MQAADIQSLHDVLRSICDKADLDYLSQPNAQAFLEGILDEARRALADVSYDRNEAHAILRLPHELMAKCFSFLPFHDRVSASQVCRTWRTAAIDTPYLWTDISDAFNGPALTAPLVECALARSGTLPLHFDSHCHLNEDLCRLVRDTMHRVASFKSFRPKQASFLEQSAPLLQTLRLWYGVYLPRNFLAGSPGSLTTLEAWDLHPPPVCPALANLSKLHIADCGAKTLQDVLPLCPRLHSLSVGSISWTHREDIGQPPESLSELRLSSPGNRYNVTKVYEAFRHCANLQRVRLQQVVSERGFEVGPVLHGAVELDVARVSDSDEFSLTARFIGGRCLTLVLYSLKYYSPSPFSCIFARNGGLDELSAVQLPFRAFLEFAKRAGPLPDAEVCVSDITDGLDYRTPRAYPWKYLSPLATLAPRKAVLIVVPRSAGDGPTEDDARGLVAELSSVAKTVEIIVRGFSPNVVPEDLVDLNNILFEC